MLKHQETVAQDPREIAAYLSTIIKSQLSWLVDEEDREAIWDEASRRFSERCGRSGTFDALPRYRENHRAHTLVQPWGRSLGGGPSRAMRTADST